MKVIYWVATIILIIACIGGGVTGVLRQPPFSDIIRPVGFPSYFMTILGVSYVLAGLALLVAGWPRVREWAQAGLMFNYIGASTSHLAVGDCQQGYSFRCLSASR